nr:MAG TPA: hypothetical protein [Caudoviricetes sp.]
MLNIHLIIISDLILFLLLENELFSLIRIIVLISF